MRSKRNIETNVTEREEAFCNQYIDNGGNATRAYEEAYGRGRKNYKTLAKSASMLSNNERIVARIKAIRDERALNSSVSREEFTQFMMSIATFDTGRLFKKTPEGLDVPKSMSELSMEERRMIQGFDKNGMPVLIDKMQAAKQIANVNGLNASNKVEVSYKGGVLGRLLGGGAIVTPEDIANDNPDTMYL